MDRGSDRAIAAFRAEVRHWLAIHVPAEPMPRITHDGQAHRAFIRNWQQVLHAGGWAGINWPGSHGGRDPHDHHGELGEG